jgi:hypothetical protein
MVSHVPHKLLTFQILKKPSTHMLVLLRIILLPCLAPSSTELQSMKLVLYMVLLLGMFSSNNHNSSKRRKVVHLPLCCFLALPISTKDNPRTISSRHYPPPLFTVTIIPNIIRTLLPHPLHLNLQVLHLLPPSHDPHCSYANLSDALNRTATRVINKLTA